MCFVAIIYEIDDDDVPIISIDELPLLLPTKHTHADISTTTQT